MRTLQQRFSTKLLDLAVLRPMRRAAGSADRLDILSESNKRRCKAQLKALEASVNIQNSKESGITRQAAVLIPMCFVDCQPSIVFTLRSSKLRSHAGQVSFPGGMVSDGDNDSVETALRESEEELGLNMSNIDVWGSMLPLPYKTGDVQITPILANLGKVEVDNFHLNYDEVDCVFTRDIMSLCSAKNFAQTTFAGPPEGGYTIPVFLGGEHKIWGLTAVILHQTLNLLAPELPNSSLAQVSKISSLQPTEDDTK